MQTDEAELFIKTEGSFVRDTPAVIFKGCGELRVEPDRFGQRLEKQLQSLNRNDPQIDAQWIDLAVRRLAEIRSGAAKTSSGDDVFSRLREKYSR